MRVAFRSLLGFGVQGEVVRASRGDVGVRSLHDAFFKHMTKPNVTGFGEM